MNSLLFGIEDAVRSVHLFLLSPLLSKLDSRVKSLLLQKK